MKSIRLLWTVTVFMVTFFALPHVNACLPNPTNYFQLSTPALSANPTADHPPEPKVFAFLIAAIIGIAVVGYILWQIVKLAQKLTPPNPPPASPTNSPPVVINPGHGPGPASAHRMTLDTNQPTWGEMGYYDITSLGYKDTWAKPPSVFYYFWSTGMTISTNLTDWEDSHYRIDAFISGTGTFFAYFHYGTNYANQYFTESTNAKAFFDLTDKPYRPVQFFRLDPK